MPFFYRRLFFEIASFTTDIACMRLQKRRIQKTPVIFVSLAQKPQNLSFKITIYDLIEIGF